jgi:DNA-binding NtrC family response regulator
MAKHILVIDDEPHFRFAASVALRRAGYRTSEAEDGREALQRILEAQRKGEVFDLLVVDVQMPVMSGIELLDELNRNGISIPVFAVSGYGDKAMVVELMRRGCSEFLDKPFEPEEMVKRVDTILQKMEGVNELECKV